MNGKSIVVVGLGNIGSHLIPHLARMENVSRIVLIDRESYEARNFVSQDILPAEAGESKALVQARRLTAIRPDLDVQAVHAPLESVPLGLWRAHLIVACLDARRGRQAAVNERAFHLGVPSVDTGVLASQSLARVNVYAPDRDAPCLECPWSDADYRLLEQQYPCEGAVETPPPTGAPSALGRPGGIAGGAGVPQDVERRSRACPRGAATRLCRGVAPRGGDALRAQSGLPVRPRLLDGRTAGLGSAGQTDSGSDRIQRRGCRGAWPSVRPPAGMPALLRRPAAVPSRRIAARRLRQMP